MSLLQWDARYSVGIPAMDLQHRKLVELINILHDAMTGGKGNEVIGAVLDELVRYTKVHFSAEERLMRSGSYPELPAHRDEHALLTKIALDLQQQHHAGAAILSVKASHFLKDWLTHHILASDRDYGVVLAKLSEKAA